MGALLGSFLLLLFARLYFLPQPSVLQPWWFAHNLLRSIRSLGAGRLPRFHYLDYPYCAGLELVNSWAQLLLDSSLFDNLTSLGFPLPQQPLETPLPMPFGRVGFWQEARRLVRFGCVPTQERPFNYPKHIPYTLVSLMLQLMLQAATAVYIGIYMDRL